MIHPKEAVSNSGYDTNKQTQVASGGTITNEIIPTLVPQCFKYWVQKWSFKKAPHTHSRLDTVAYIFGPVRYFLIILRKIGS